MAIIQSVFAKGIRQCVRPQSAGAQHAQLYTFDFATQAMAVGDILEIGELPPFARFVDAVIIPEGDFTGVNVDVGLMSGEYGSTDTARTVGNQLFAAQAVQYARLTKGEALLIKSIEGSRSIGVKPSAAIAAGAKKLHLLVTFYQTGE